MQLQINQKNIFGSNSTRIGPFFSMLKIATIFAVFCFSVPTLAGEKITKLSCASGEVAKWNENGWVCAADLNTNAGTLCTAGQYLDGDGSCQAIPVNTNTNAGTLCVAGQYLDGDGSCKAIPEDLPTLPSVSSGGYALVYCGDTDSIQWLSGTRYAIGDTGPAGGIVFYTTNCGAHGLEAAPEDQSSSAGAIWGCSGTSIATETAIGTGADNTAKILAICTNAGIAADIVDDYELNGYTDWFLPSSAALNELYQQRAVVGGFVSAFYWSSSEDGSGSAWGQSFAVGNQVTVNKSGALLVRAVRAF